MTRAHRHGGAALRRQANPRRPYHWERRHPATPGKRVRAGTVLLTVVTVLVGLLGALAGPQTAVAHAGSASMPPVATPASSDPTDTEHTAAPDGDAAETTAPDPVVSDPTDPVEPDSQAPAPSETAPPMSPGERSSGLQAADAPVPLDFGDAPADYDTSLADGGARHDIPGYDEVTDTAPLMLGSTIDPETDGQPSAAANGDGRDEDGVSGPLGLVIGQPLEVPVAVTNATGQPATLAGWIDLNADGDFADADELQRATVPADSGSTTQTLTWPAPTTPGDGTYARFRLFPGDIPAGDLAPTGAAAGGEVEDYFVVGPVAVFLTCPRVYALQGQSPFSIYRVDTDSGSMSIVGQMNAGTASTVNNNGMGISADARYVFTHRNGTIYRYDAQTGATTSYPGTSSLNATHGAVDPASGTYYYGNVSSGNTAATVYAFDTSTNTSLGQVATVNFGAAAPGGNGDWVFDREGNFYLTAGATGTNVDNDLYRVTESLPTSGGAPKTVSADLLNTITTPASINGVAFDGAGFLYLASSNAIYQVNPGSGVVEDTANLSPSGASVDLASCASPSTVTVQKDVVGRAAPGDQFQVSVTGGGITDNNTGTTTGTDVGLQTDDVEVAGPVLGLPGTEYSVSESGADGADLGDYEIAWECVDTTNGDEVVASGTGADGSFTMPASVGGIGSAIVCTFTNDVVDVDFGDAPASYGTTAAGNGARHPIIDGLRLGGSVDFESDGQPNPAADGDGADEDGVSGPIETSAGSPVTVTVSATNDTGLAATLVGWIDLNGNGTFDNGGERVIVPVPAGSGTDDYDLAFPADTVGTNTYARFRLFPGTVAPADALPAGAAAAGEVEDYPVTILATDLAIEKTSDAAIDARPGDTVTYTVTATNTGPGDYTAANPARIWDDLSGVLDDAAYSDDATADRGADPVYADPVISWIGELPAGASVTVTYTVVLQAGGDGTVRNVAFEQCAPGDTACDTATPQCDPPVGGVDSGTGKVCAEEEFELPKLSIVKAADRTDLPAVGETVTYTVTVTNEGPGDYTAAAPATMSDDMSDVLDDADIDESSISFDVGTATFSSPDLEWTGVLAAGESATISYTVTYTGVGDEMLLNNACVPVEEAQDPQDPCAQVRVPGSGLDPDKVSDPATGEGVEVGEEITYTLRFTNTGQTSATVDTFDNLSGVLDDADFVFGSITTDTGLIAAFDPDNQRIDVTGTVPVGEALEVSYRVLVRAWSDQGNHLLRNALQCQAGDPPACEPEITEHPVRALDVEKTSDRTADTVIGDTVTYSVTATNIGEADYTGTGPALVRDTLAGVLDDADYNDDASADLPGTLVYDQPVIRWEGALAVDETVTITYTATLTGDGDLNVRNVAWGGPGPDPQCDPPTDQGVDPTTGQPCAEVEYGLPRIVDEKSVDPADRTVVEAGDELTYTLRFENLGQGAGAVSKDDSLVMLLDDAEIIDGPESSDPSLSAALVGDRIEVRGALGAGDAATVTYTVQVKSDADRVADGGDDMLGNFLIEPGATPPSGCEPEVEEDSTCNPVRELGIAKTSDRTADSTFGDTITYTVTASNTGEADYTVADPALVRDTMVGVLDDAVYNDDAAADLAGTLSYSQPVIRWEGALEVGQSVTITYTVTLERGGDLNVRNVAWRGPGPEPECDPPTAAGYDPVTGQPCAEVKFGLPDLTDSKSVNPRKGSMVNAGQTLDYTLRFSNNGTAPGTVARVDDLSQVLDDARVVSPPVSSDPALRVSAIRGGRFTITGTLTPGQTVTVTYGVQIKQPARMGDRMLANHLLEPGQKPPGSRQCLNQMGKDSTCNRVRKFDLALAKRAVSGPQVMVGDEVRYRLQVSNTGPDAAPAPITLTDPLPDGLELQSARGKGWDCKVQKGSDTVTCVRSRNLDADHRAQPVFVVATATSSAGDQLVNVAQVSSNGDVKRSNDDDRAGVRVVEVPPLPGTGFRIM